LLVESDTLIEVDVDFPIFRFGEIPHFLEPQLREEGGGDLFEATVGVVDKPFQAVVEVHIGEKVYLQGGPVGTR